MAPVIRVVGLVKHYGDLQAVRNVSFEVHEGEIFGLLGPNGAGKTTSVECVQGLRVPDSGTIEVLGMDPRTDARRLRSRIGSQLQESSLPHRITVTEALQLFSSLQPTGPDWRQVAVQWGLERMADASFGSLSGGQRQRLLVALALVNQPEIVFLDEMTTGLDPAARRATWDLIEQIRATGTTVVLVTHFMDEAERLCDRLAVVAEGVVVAMGTPAELVAANHSRVTIRFTAPKLDLTALDTIEGVSSVERHAAVVKVIGDPSIAARVGSVLVERALAPSDFEVIRPSLEDVYLELVGRGDG